MRNFFHSATCIFVTAYMYFFAVVPSYAQEIRIGSYEFPDGSIYQGEIFRGKPYGRGTTRFPYGDIHEGMYVKGKRHGQGTYKFADREKYIGEWYQGQQHGWGLYYFINNNR